MSVSRQAGKFYVDGGWLGVEAGGAGTRNSGLALGLDLDRRSWRERGRDGEAERQRGGEAERQGGRERLRGEATTYDLRLTA